MRKCGKGKCYDDFSVVFFFLIKKSMNFSNSQLVKPNGEALKEKKKKKKLLRYVC